MFLGSGGGAAGWRPASGRAARLLRWCPRTSPTVGAPWRSGERRWMGLPVTRPKLIWMLDANAGLAYVPSEEAPLLWNVEARCLGSAGGGHGRDWEFTMAVIAE
eukprot:3667362-Prorocentrum_lima.AAC.1